MNDILSSIEDDRFEAYVNSAAYKKLEANYDEARKLMKRISKANISRLTVEESYIAFKYLQSNGNPDNGLYTEKEMGKLRKIASKVW